MKFVYGDKVKINYGEPFYDNSKLTWHKRGKVVNYDFSGNTKLYKVEFDASSLDSKYFCEEQLEHEHS